MRPRFACFALLSLPFVSAADSLPSVASINLCSDQLVLGLADAQQILSVSWLAADPEESMFAAEAAQYPLNYGSAEEILRFDPDVVIAGTFTNTFSRQLLRELGYDVIDVSPAQSIAEIERNVRQVAAALHQTERAERVIARMHEHVEAIENTRPSQPITAVVIRPGGFTVGANTLADELIRLAGLRNVAAENGLDRWGSLSLETLLVNRPDMLILTGYRRDERSLANLVLEHPALERLASRIPTATVAARHWSCELPESLQSADILQQSVRAIR
jgi:iron complex transport system substrate-binding protein